MVMKFDLYGHGALMINHGIIVIGLCSSTFAAKKLSINCLRY